MSHKTDKNNIWQIRKSPPAVPGERDPSPQMSGRQGLDGWADGRTERSTTAPVRAWATGQPRPGAGAAGFNLDWDEEENTGLPFGSLPRSSRWLSGAPARRREAGFVERARSLRHDCTEWVWRARHEMDASQVRCLRGVPLFRKQHKVQVLLKCTDFLFL